MERKISHIGYMDNLQKGQWKERFHIQGTWTIYRKVNGKEDFTYRVHGQFTERSMERKISHIGYMDNLQKGQWKGRFHVQGTWALL